MTPTATAMAADVPTTLLTTLHSHPHWSECQTVRVAFSGGVDSVCLLHALCAVRGELGRGVEALHVDHGLAADSAGRAERCVAQCAEWGVAVRVLSVTVRAGGGESLQTCARRERYAALSAQLSDGDFLLTAHQRDDQAETVLFHLLRGAGASGLRAIPAWRRLGAGYVCRPLLALGRDELLAYARAHGLRWDDDDANRDLRFDRNFLRHKVLPMIVKRWPRAAEALARSASHLAEADALLAELARGDLLRCRVTHKPGIPAAGALLSVAQLMQLSSPRLRNALRAWLSAHDLPALSAARLGRLCDVLRVTTRSGAMRFDVGAVAVRRYRDVLLVDAHPDSNFRAEKKFSIVDGATFPQLGYKIICRQTESKGIAQRVLNNVTCTLRPRAGGERCRAAGAQHHRPLKKILAEHGVPPWERRRLPLLFIGDRLAAVPGVLICDWCAAGDGEASVEMVLELLKS